MIQTVANFARGVKQTAASNSNYWGISVSRATLDRYVKQYCKDLDQCHGELLKSELAVKACIDNIQRGERKAEQSGGSSSNHVSGTSHLVFKVVEYSKDTFDQRNVSVVFHDEQNIPSPEGMPDCSNAFTDDNFDSFLLDGWKAAGFCWGCCQSLSKSRSYHDVYQSLCESFQYSRCL